MVSEVPQDGYAQTAELFPLGCGTSSAMGDIVDIDML